MSDDNLDKNIEEPTPTGDFGSGEAASQEALSQEDNLFEKQLQECQSKASEYLDGWQRARAEFANYKKRVERDQAQTYQYVTGNIIKKYLDIQDDIELALKNRPQEGEGAAWASGIELIARKLSSILESEGVKPIQTNGEEFDPNLHEALTHEESADYDSGQIIGVVKQGYTMGDKVLRPALVRVAR